MSSPWIVMVAVDGSETAEKAFEWAMQNVVSSHTRLLLVMARDVTFKEELAQARAVLAKFAKDKRLRSWVNNKDLHFECKTAVLQQDGRGPGQTIVTYCEQVRPNILVLGSRGRGALKRTMLGSVSDYSVHNCKCPVVVVRPTELVQKHLEGLDDRAKNKSELKVVLAVDSSKHSMRALDWVLSTLPQWVDFTILHVAKPSAAEAEGLRLLATFSKVVDAREGYSCSTKMVRHKKPGVAIQEYCEAAQPNLLVTASRGLGSLKRQLLGSTSAHLIHHVPCAVMVYKDDMMRGNSGPQIALENSPARAGGEGLVDSIKDLDLAGKQKLVGQGAEDSASANVV